MLSIRTQRDESMSGNVGQTIRQPSTALLCIDSEDRWANYTQRRNATPGSYNYSPYDFIITKNESLMNGFFTRLAVSEVVFPWVVPNINKTTNRIKMTYNIGEDDIVKYVTLDQGFYPGFLLSAEFISKVIDAADGDLDDFNCRYDDVNGLGGQFVYETGDPDKGVSFQPMTYQPNPSLPGYYEFQDNVKQLFDLMAFGNINTELAVSASGSFTFCQATRYVDIVCSQLVYNQALKDTMSQPSARDVLCRVYLGNNFRYVQDPAAPVESSKEVGYAPGTFPTIVGVQYSTPKQIQWVPNQPVPSGLRFQVFDDNGIPLNELFDLSIIPSAGVSEADWSMTLLVSEN
jgi:hypothetical protein